MNKSQLPLTLLLVLAIAWIARPGALAVSNDSATGSPSPSLAPDESNPDIFTGSIDPLDYLRNPDGTARIIFTNFGGPVNLTVCGTKNLSTADTRFADTGPLEFRTGSEIGPKTKIIGTVARNQPVWAVRSVVPGSENGNPVNVYIWNGDRDRIANISYCLHVGDKN